MVDLCFSHSQCWVPDETLSMPASPSRTHPSDEPTQTPSRQNWPSTEPWVPPRLPTTHRKWFPLRPSLSCRSQAGRLPVLWAWTRTSVGSCLLWGSWLSWTLKKHSQMNWRYSRYSQLRKGMRWINPFHSCNIGIQGVNLAGEPKELNWICSIDATVQLPAFAWSMYKAVVTALWVCACSMYIHARSMYMHVYTCQCQVLFFYRRTTGVCSSSWRCVHNTIVIRLLLHCSVELTRLSVRVH